MTSEPAESSIRFHEHTIHPQTYDGEIIHVHVTEMKESFMIWIGTMKSVHLNDFILAIPPLKNGQEKKSSRDIATSSIFSISESTLSTSIASRLAQIFQCPIYFAMDLPELKMTENTYEPELLVYIERELTRFLREIKSIEKTTTTISADKVEVGR